MASPQALQVNAHAPSRPALDTFPKLLLNHAAVRGNRPAMREKDLGIWQTWSWAAHAAGRAALNLFRLCASAQPVQGVARRVGPVSGDKS